MRRFLYLLALAALIPISARAQQPTAPPPGAEMLAPPPGAPVPPEAFAPEAMPPGAFADMDDGDDPMALDMGGAAGDLGDMDMMMPPPPPPQDPQNPPPPPRKPDPKKVAELKARILQFKYDRMKKFVAMDEETWDKFFKIYKPAESDIEAIVKQRNAEMRTLGQLMNGAKTDADVDPEMDKIRDLNKRIEDRVAKLNDDLKPVLSPRQRARLLVFEHDFNTKLREQIAKRRAQNRGPLTDEERKMRQQKMRQWWLDHHPAHRDAIDGAPPAPGK